MDSLRVFHPPPGNASTDPLTGLGSGPPPDSGTIETLPCKFEYSFLPTPAGFGTNYALVPFPKSRGIRKRHQMVPKPVDSGNRGTVGRDQRAQGNAEISDSV